MYTYDKNGRLETETKKGITNTYTYNKAGLLTKLTDGIDEDWIRYGINMFNIGR